MKGKSPWAKAHGVYGSKVPWIEIKVEGKTALVSPLISLGMIAEANGEKMTDFTAFQADAIQGKVTVRIFAGECPKFDE